MSPEIRYDIDDTDGVRPHVRLSRLILREALESGFRAVELTGSSNAVPTARAQTAEGWQPFMAFPQPVYRMLIEYFKEMAGSAHAIPVRCKGREAEVGLRVPASSGGPGDLILEFPAHAREGPDV